MSVDPGQEDRHEFSDVNPVVSETLDSALGQLHLDDLEGTAVSGESQEAGIQNVSEPYSATFSGAPPSHMFPHPQMIGMGFIPFSQMIPLPHHTGFFPHPEFRDAAGMQVETGGTGAVLFNNTDDISMINSSNPVQTQAGYDTATLADKPSGPTNANDPLWYSSHTQANNVVDPLNSSSAIEESKFLDESLPRKTPGGAVRRQTFHAISTNDLINAGVSNTNIADSNTSATRIPEPTRASLVISTESIPATIGTNSGAVGANSTSVENPDTEQLFNVVDFAAKKDGDISVAGSSQIAKVKEGATSPSYAAAYPYGGPLLQPNPVLSGHTPPGSQPAYGIPSPFHGAYGFASPFQFSPVVGNPNNQIPPPRSPNSHSAFQPVLTGDRTSTSVGNRQSTAEDDSHSEDQQNILAPQHAMQLHQQSGTPPPWMYGGHPFGIVPHPHSVPQGHPHMLHANGPHAMNGHNNHNSRRGQSHNGSSRNSKPGSFGNSKNKHNKSSQYYHSGSYNNDRHKKNEDSSRYADAHLKEFIGNIYSLCKDQHGCRFLQKQLDILGVEAADAIFIETSEYTVELMTDSFGNYLIQKLLEGVTTEQRIALTKIAAPHFVYIASNPHGTRALQKLVECIDTDEEAEIVVNSLRGSIVQLSKDLNGNHIVQKCLQKLQPKNIQFIFDAACLHCVDIATHRHGCCVLQRCLDHGSFGQRKDLCEKLLLHVDLLTLDPFGNYVVQYIITRECEDGKNEFTHRIVKALTPKFTDLSLHKFGSNVIEKILRTPDVSQDIVLSFLESTGEAEVQALLNDCYGNYVLQTMLDVSKESNESSYRRLVELVRPLLVGSIRNTPHGRRIMGILQMDQLSNA